MSLFTQWVPHTWSDEPHTEELEAYADRIIDGYNELAPNFKQSILHRQVIGPHQMEHDYHLIGGNIFHGELSTEQLFHMRPAPGFADYTTPIKGLYQCSSATHAGGGVTGIPAYLASKRILADRKLNRFKRRQRSEPDRRPAPPLPAGRARSRPRPARLRADAAPRRVRRSRGPAAGSWSTSSPAPGCASGAPAKVAEPGEPRTAARIGKEGVLLVRGRVRRAARVLERVPAPRPRAAARAASRTSARRSPARTTRGSTTSTARCAPRRASTRRKASTSPSTSCSACRWRSGTAGCSSNASGNAGSFEDHIGGFDALVAPYEPGRLVVGATHEYRLEANWKLAIENYHECYHCPVIHPELCRVSPPTSGENFSAPGLAIGGSMELVDGATTMSLTGEQPAAAAAAASTRSCKRDVLYAGVFPNMLDQPAPRLRDDAPHRAARARRERGSSASGSSTRTRSPSPTSTRPSRSTSGISRTARTGARARACSGGSSRAATTRARSRSRKTVCGSGPPRLPGATSRVECDRDRTTVAGPRGGRRARRQPKRRGSSPGCRSRASCSPRRAGSLVGGVASNWQSAPPQAVWVTHGKGSHVFDADGTEYVDLHAGFGVMLVGHAHPVIVRSGLGTGRARARTSRSRCPTRSSWPRSSPRRFGLPRWRFGNSGTEATMNAVHLMRAATGRQKIIKVEGSYHGHHDHVQFSVYPTLEEAGPGVAPEHRAHRAGDPRGASCRSPSSCRSAISTPSRGVLAEHPGEIAGMLMEPAMMNISVIPPPGRLPRRPRATCCTPTARCSRSTR